MLEVARAIAEIILLHMSDDSYLLGIQAFREKKYEEALQLLKVAPLEQWDAQLYLGMSYYMLGRHVDAREHFQRMREQCPDPELREQAVAAVSAVNSKIMQECRIQKSEDEMTIEW